MIGRGRPVVLGNERGMALLITIMIISLLVVVTLEFGKAMRQNHLAAINLKTGEQLGAIARSGVTLAAVLLAEDGKKNTYDTLLEDWAAVDRADLSGLFNQGRLQIKVTDLSGRLQVNSLVKSGEIGTEGREILTRLLLSGNFAVDGEAEVRAIVDSLVDWLDVDDQESDAGAENSYYQSLSPSYSCRNAKVEFVEDILLVKGVTPALLYGADGKKALSQFITVYGDDGKINLDTAELELIEAIQPLITSELAARMDEYRRAKENSESLAASAWYKNIPSWPGDITLNDAFITTKSSYFSIESIGELETQKRMVVAVVRRAQQGKITEITRKVQ